MRTIGNKTLTRAVGVVSLMLLVQLIITFQLWMQVRDFPLAPVFEILPKLNFSWFGYLMFSLIFISVTGMNFHRVRQPSVIIFLTILSFSVLLDVTRLQAWIFMYALLLFPLCFLKPDDQETQTALRVMRLVIICTYFWSGFHKLNIHFLEGTFPWMLSGISWLDLLNKFWIACFTPFFEMGIAALLFIRKTRTAGIIMAGLFHLIILVLLGPLGLNWNEIVWPWNLGLIPLVYVFFSKDENDPVSWRQLFKFRPAGPVLLLAGLMPLLHVAEKWDSNLSFSMYSGLADEAVFYFEDRNDNCIPETYDHLIFGDSKGVAYISIDDWTMEELRVPGYASVTVFKRLARSWCKCQSDPSLSGLEMLKIKGRWTSETEFVKIPCVNLIEVE